MEHLPKELSENLVIWFRAAHRDLPWRRDRAPYHVWLSEIMLQQTRVEAVRGYYERFLQELPTIDALAACAPDRLNKLWQGLGYYSRARNLQKAAQWIVTELGGVFPSTLEQIRTLPGVGAYTAGAIASICFELPTPAVDGNVLRVLSRVMADSACVSQQKVKDAYAERLAEIYPPDACGDFTQSLMELGATVCLPNGAPRCDICPVARLCKAYAQGNPTAYPVKQEKKARRQERLTVFHLLCGGCVAVQKRPETGLLANLWELPHVDGFLETADAMALLRGWGVQPKELLRRQEKTHIFTHVEWHMRCYSVVCGSKAGDFTWADEARFARDIALPSAFLKLIEPL